jgi:small-conductance mechanosensitive channel
MYTSYLPQWGDVIVASLQNVWSSVIGFLPLLIGALIVFIVGWVIAVSLGRLVEHVIKSLRFDSVLEQLEFHKVLDRAGMKLNSGAFIGGLVRWFLIVVFLLASLDILQLTQVSEFLREVLNFLPQVIVAAMILLIAAVVAETVEKTAKASIEAAGMKSGAVTVLVRWAIWTFAIIAALYQLNVASILLQQLVSGLIYTFALAIGLAFGLGGKEVAADILGKMKKEMTNKM